MALSEEKLYSVGRRWVYIFNRREAKKFIPVNLTMPCQQSIAEAPPDG